MIPLEDFFNDVIGKARRGLGLSPESLAARAGLDVVAVNALESGELDEAALRAVAGPLQLNADALLRVARGESVPSPIKVPGLACFNTPYEDMTVNAYLLFDPESKEAVVFDTGADADPMLAFAREQELRIGLILLTHTHGDHIFDLDRLREITGAPAWVNEAEALPGLETFVPGKTFTCGRLKISTHLTWGHARAGITFVAEGLPRSVAVVGDALFARSMGGGAVSYADALRTTREEILSLPDDTVLCPGHGPLTTVAEEKRENPFFA